MGEVYRAKDWKLRREVAIKVLPSAVSRDSERLARFEREAHLLAFLSHPNIGAIHGLRPAVPERFLMIRSADPESPPARLHVVRNWFEDLKRRVPSGRS